MARTCAVCAATIAVALVPFVAAQSASPSPAAERIVTDAVASQIAALVAIVVAAIVVGVIYMYGRRQHGGATVEEWKSARTLATDGATATAAGTGVAAASGSGSADTPRSNEPLTTDIEVAVGTRAAFAPGVVRR